MWHERSMHGPSIHGPPSLPLRNASASP
jgi:energy-coupling factor transporter transmembrane protein EcfT